jgi:hypothetical protein
MDDQSVRNLDFLESLGLIRFSSRRNLLIQSWPRGVPIGRTIRLSGAFSDM